MRKDIEEILGKETTEKMEYLKKWFGKDVIRDLFNKWAKENVDKSIGKEGGIIYDMLYPPTFGESLKRGKSYFEKMKDYITEEVASLYCFTEKALMIPSENAGMMYGASSR